MSDTTNAALIAEARKRESLAAVHLPGQESPTLATSLANALEAADARNTELEAERAGDIAVILDANRILTDSHLPLGQKTAQARAALMAAPADALAEHGRVIAEKAWDAGKEALALATLPGSAPLVNPYRANPEPKEGEHE